MTLQRELQTFPQLETNSLLLLRIISGDANALFKILSDPEVTEFYDEDEFVDISQASDQIPAWENGFINKRSIRWGIIRKDKDDLMGSCGYYGFHSWNNRASIGYELARTSWRQGIMTEALSAIINFGFRRLELNRIDALVMPGNTASINLLEKLGFRNEGLLKEYERWGSKGFVDLCMFAILRKDWSISRT
jgi:ribosomal-protein-alanine N-acetyltransferase